MVDYPQLIHCINGIRNQVLRGLDTKFHYFAAIAPEIIIRIRELMIDVEANLIDVFGKKISFNDVKI
jgi:hypothetical protein